VVVAVDDVSDVVERRSQRDDDGFVRLIEPLLACAVEFDAAAFQQVVQTQRPVADDFDVFLPVVVVLLPLDGVDVLCRQIRVHLCVGLQQREHRVDPLVREGVSRVGVVLPPAVAVRFRIAHTAWTYPPAKRVLANGAVTGVLRGKSI
jgi:hypothetical protein